MRVSPYAKNINNAETALYISELEQLVANSIEQNFDLVKGTGKITGLISFEPRTEEQICQLLRIDTKIWELKQYWNKEKSNGHWLVSALIGRKKTASLQDIKQILTNFSPSYKPVIAPSYINENNSEDCIGVLSLQDLHFGKDGNDDISDLFVQAIKDLVMRGYRSHKLKKIILVLGGDLLNMDTFNGTTTSGTPVENGLKATQTFSQALDRYTEAVAFIAHFCQNLEVLYIPGNHDRLSSYHLAVTVSKVFAGQPNILFDIEYAERKVKLEGINFLAFEHGDTNLKLSPLVFATEFAKLWGQAEFRTVYTGHTHKKKTIIYTVEDETNGIDVKTLPALCSTDYFHYHNKWTGNKRRAVFEIHGYVSGLLDQLSFVPSQKKVA